MKRAYKPAAGNAKGAHEAGCANTEAGFGRSGGIADRARKLWPQKTAANLALHAGISQRRAEQILEGDGTLSLEAFAELLRSDYGQPFFELVMTGSDAAWWQHANRAMRLRDLVKSQKELQRDADRLRAELASISTEVL